MEDIFESPKGMLAWGKKRIRDFKTEIEAFDNKKPWSYIVERDANSGQYLHKIIFSESVNDCLSLLAFESVGHLRAALDQIGFAIAVWHTEKSEPKDAYFPFGDTKSEARGNATTRCKDLPSEIVTFFLGFKPFKPSEGGNASLWPLNKLTNIGKHRFLKPLWAGAYVNTSQPEVFPAVVARKKWKSNTNEIIFMRSDSDVRFYADVSLDIAFDNVPEISTSQPAIAMLDAMAREVERILFGTEAECRRLGLIT